MKSLCIGLLILTLAAPVSAETNPLAWKSNQQVADWLSTGGVAASIGLDTLHNWNDPHRGEALKCEAFRLGMTVGIAELTKAFVHRTRPDGSDNKSFFSEHTALAAASATGWKLGIGFTIGVGYGRMAANKHYGTDVLVGAGVGALSHLLSCN